MTAKVSVIIPVYNTAEYLRECLDSVLAQDIGGLEAVCINDGSPDNSIDILREYAAKDSRVVVIDKPNEGVAAARNDGIKAATGEFIAFMDSDDFYPNPSVLRILYDAAVGNGVDVSGGHYFRVAKDGTRTETRFRYKRIKLDVKGFVDYRDFQYDLGYICYVFRTSLLRDNGIVFPLYSRFQDPPFFVRAMFAAGRFYAIDEPTYCYRFIPSDAKTKIDRAIDAVKGMTENLLFARQNNLARLHYISACRLNEEASFMAIHNLDDKRIVELLSLLVKANAAVDVEWLKEEGFKLNANYLFSVFKYMADTSVKYEKLRKNPILKFCAKIIGK